MKAKRADYQARVRTPFAVLGVRTECDVLVGIDFLALDAPRLAAQDPFTAEVCRQLRAYLDEPRLRFDLPIAVGGTVFQRRVWDEVARIPCGETRAYAEVATRTGSGARAVGNACGANRVPLVIPCHRVVGSHGLGGFMNAHGGFCLAVKRWLLDHECR
jgi:methylated-DNA-[protein]-cysteine S-methyltransferase